MKNILIVDDNYGILDMFEYNLQDIPDLYISKAPNLDEAFKIIISTHIDLLLLDIRMGESDGISLLDEIPDDKKDFKTIIITGCDPMHESVLDANKRGFVVFHKPFNVDEIVNYIKNVL